MVALAPAQFFFMEYLKPPVLRNTQHLSTLNALLHGFFSPGGAACGERGLEPDSIRALTDKSYLET